MKLILVTGMGIGKSFVAGALQRYYKSSLINTAKLKHIETGTTEEAAAAINECEDDFLILVSNQSAEALQVIPWQTITIEGGSSK